MVGGSRLGPVGISPPAPNLHRHQLSTVICHFHNETYFLNCLHRRPEDTSYLRSVTNDSYVSFSSLSELGSGLKLKSDIFFTANGYYVFYQHLASCLQPRDFLKCHRDCFKTPNVAETLEKLTFLDQPPINVHVSNGSFL